MEQPGTYFGIAELDIMEAMHKIITEAQEIKLPLDVFKTASQKDDGWFVTHTEGVSHGDEEKGS